MSGWRVPAGKCRCGRGIRVLGRWCEACAKREADKIVGAFVKRRDKCCVVPGCSVRTGLEWAHIQSRRYLRIRWRPDAAVALCRDHHRMFTGEPEAWQELIEHLYPGRWAYLLVERERPGRPDLASIITTFGKGRAA